MPDHDDPRPDETLAAIDKMLADLRRLEATAPTAELKRHALEALVDGEKLRGTLAFLFSISPAAPDPDPSLH